MSAIDDSLPSETAPPSGGAWALPLLALGIGVIALCSIIPATDDNRLLVFERERLKAELLGLERQVELNAEFLDRIHRERGLALRLASRQRAGLEQDVALLAPTRPAQAGAGGLGNFTMSPFALVAAAPAAEPLAPIPPAGGRVAALCRHPRARLAMLGLGLLACMFGLLGGGGVLGTKPSAGPRLPRVGSCPTRQSAPLHSKPPADSPRRPWSRTVASSPPMPSAPG